jgi:hypothetical protein
VVLDLTPLRSATSAGSSSSTGRYARDEGFDGTFEPLVARILADFADGHDPACERGWIARAGEGARARSSA